MRNIAHKPVQVKYQGGYVCSYAEGQQHPFLAIRIIAMEKWALSQVNQVNQRSCLNCSSVRPELLMIDLKV
jgi:hypothetical protein